MTSNQPNHIHRRSSSKWIPSTAPLHNPIAIFRGRPNRENGSRVIRPNHLFETPRYELSNFLNFTDNQISTTKYSLWNFVPLNIWHQISTKYANIYFIFIAVLNWVPFFDTYTRYVGLIPITFVLGTTLIKDGVEDFRRWKFDRQINRRTCLVWDRERGAFRKTEWRFVLVGDFVHISNDQEIPADIIFMRSSNEAGTCYLETSNLDGETSLKQRMVPAKVIDLSLKTSNFAPSDFSGIVTCEKPDKAIYTIRAKIEYEPGKSDVITKENMLLRGCRIKNTTFVEGIVVYAGHDTKVMMNNGRAPRKVSSIERLTNRFIIFCFILLMLMVFYGSIMSAIWADNHPINLEIPFITSNMPRPFIEGLIGIGALFINYQILVPISLYITVEIIKALQIYFMSNDLQLYHRKSDHVIDCRSLSIPEELGTITHVLSDKTGTLTENVMIFRNCAFDDIDYGGEIGDELKMLNDKPIRSDLLHQKLLSSQDDPNIRHFFLNILLNNSVIVNRIPRTDLLELGTFEAGCYNIGNSHFYDVTASMYQQIIEAAQSETSIERPNNLNFTIRFDDELTVITEEETPESQKNNESISDESPSTTNSSIFRPFTSIYELSHKVSKVFRRSILRPISDIIPLTNRKRLTSFKQSIDCPYEAESPDELALIQGASQYDYLLLERAATSITIAAPDMTEKRFQLLLTLPFDASRKRMSVIIRTSEGPLLYSKGADSAILPNLRIDSDDVERVEKICRNLENYAKKGLRTLCFAMKIIPQNVFDDFYDSYRFIMEDSSADREQMLSDKASEIETDLRLLGVTGIEDRLQAGVDETIRDLRDAGCQVWILTGDKLETAQNIATSSGLFHPNREIRVVRNETEAELTSEATGANIILSPEAIRMIQTGNVHLIETLKKAKSVLCYRMTPSEKATIVRTVKTRLNGKVLAIGDGANDVPMIQAADVGIGIAGKEGLQAAMACDFAIAQFHFLSRLLLVHGHWNYYRLSATFLFFLYKNTNNVLILFFFQFYNGYSGNSDIDPLWSVLYPIIFTSVQPVVFGVLDQDDPADELMTKPERYSVGRENRLYTNFLFFCNIVDAIYQAAVIFFVSFFALDDSQTTYWEFGFYLATASMLVNSLHLAIHVRYWHWRIFVIFIAFFFFHFAFFLLLYLSQAGILIVPDAPISMTINCLSDARFWFTMLAIVVLAICPRFLSICLYATFQAV